MTRIQWTSETWRSVPGWPCEVSNYGGVRGPSGKILKPSDSASGHLHIVIRRRKLRVHHAVLLAFSGPRLPGQECRHLDDNPKNNYLENLRWGTRLENQSDRAANGRIKHGESKVQHVLTAAQVEVIRMDRRPSRVIGPEYGVSHTTILGIRRGRLWRLGT